MLLVDINGQRRTYENGVEGDEDSQGEEDIFHGVTSAIVSQKRPPGLPVPPVASASLNGYRVVAILVPAVVAKSRGKERARNDGTR